MRALRLLLPILLVAAPVARAQNEAVDEDGVWLRATVVEATQDHKLCDRALRRIEGDLRKALPNYGYAVLREEVRRARMGERVELRVDDEQTVEFTPESADDRATRAALVVRRAGAAAPAGEDLREVEVWHHKTFAVGRQRGDRGATLLLIETWR